MNKTKLKNTARFEYKIGQNNFELVHIKHPSGSSAEIYLYGAHLTSLILNNSEDIMFLSPNAIFEEGTSIRGGVPVIFPQFSALGTMRVHGFARVSQWKVVNDYIDQEDRSVLELELINNPKYTSEWPHKFNLRLVLKLGESLHMSLDIENADQESFNFSNAFHTYFKVGNINECEILNLKDVILVDYLDNKNTYPEDREKINLTRHTDRIYLNAPETVLLNDIKLGRQIQISKHNFNDVVVWNPWDKAANLKDLKPESYLDMLCIEVANTHESVKLAAGAIYKCQQTISVKNL